MYLNKEAQRAIADAVFFASVFMEPWDRDELFDRVEKQIQHHNETARNSMPPEKRFSGDIIPKSYRSRIDSLKQKRGLHPNY